MTEERSVTIVNVVGASLFLAYVITFFVFTTNKKLLFRQFTLVLLVLITVIFYTRHETDLQEVTRVLGSYYGYLKCPEGRSKYLLFQESFVVPWQFCFSPPLCRRLCMYLERGTRNAFPFRWSYRISLCACNGWFMEWPLRTSLYRCVLLFRFFQLTSAKLTSDLSLSLLLLRFQIYWDAFWSAFSYPCSTSILAARSLDPRIGRSYRKHNRRGPPPCLLTYLWVFAEKFNL